MIRWGKKRTGSGGLVVAAVGAAACSVFSTLASGCDLGSTDPSPRRAPTPAQTRAAPTRLLDVGPWYLVGTKTRVFANKAGTLSVGTAAPQNCTNFTLAGPGQLGQAGSVQELPQRTQAGNDTCNTTSRLYCIEQWRLSRKAHHRRPAAAER